MLAGGRAASNRELLDAAMSLAGRCAAFAGYAGALSSERHSTTQAAVR
jgi:hypothetical protein